MPGWVRGQQAEQGEREEWDLRRVPRTGAQVR